MLWLFCEELIDLRKVSFEDRLTLLLEDYISKIYEWLSPLSE